MAEMSWTELRDAADAGTGVILPVGAIEQHGPHLPLATDALIATEIARAVAADHDMIVAPPLTYGCRSRPLSGGGPDFPGTTSLRPTTFMDIVEDVVRELVRHSFRRLVVLSAHWENRNFVFEGAYRVREDAARKGARIMVIESAFSNTISPETLGALFGEDWPGLAREHAAIIETSLLLHLRPDLVREDRIVDDAQARYPWWEVIPAPPEFSTPSGVMWMATQASKEKGERLWADVSRAMSEAVAEELYSSSKGIDVGTA